MLVAIGDGFGETPLGLAEPALIALERVHIRVGSARQLLHVSGERDLQRLVHDGTQSPPWSAMAQASVLSV